MVLTWHFAAIREPIISAVAPTLVRLVVTATSRIDKTEHLRCWITKASLREVSHYDHDEWWYQQLLPLLDRHI